MKHKNYLLAFTSVSLLLSVLLAPVAHAQNTQNFTVQSFSADYYLDRTDNHISTLRVEEVITAVFPNHDQNHGILRSIPQTYKDLPLNIQVQQITNTTGGSSAFVTNVSNDNLVIKIGSVGQYVHGTQTYHIKYTLKNAVSFYKGHDELYWDVNGDQWQQPFDQVTSRVHMPTAIAAGLQDRQLCHSGIYHSAEQNCQISRSQNGDETIVTTTAHNLPVGGNLSFVLAFDKGVFAVDKTALFLKRLRFAATILLATVLPLTAFIIMYRRWQKIGKDAHSRGTIIPQYLPPKDFSALSSDVLMHERLRNQAISALIIELAIKKYLAIYEIPKEAGLLHGKSTEYELGLLKPADDLGEEELEALKMFFADLKPGERISLSKLKNQLYVESDLLGKKVTSGLAARGYFRTDPTKIRNQYVLWGSIILGSALFAGGAAAGMFGSLGVGLLIGWALSGIIVLLFALIMPARTEKGVEVHDYLLGLRSYIKLAEADRLEYLQSPEGVHQYGDPKDPKSKVKLFERLLPYAMIFGLEHGWANQFKDVYTQPPDWYHGNWSTFSTIYLVSSLNGFTAASGTSFTAPQSSTASGFGGGGFSGGGGGGGGGGGW